ncbi:hypothetical protein FRC12_003932 [Ceratobasidium sp. 428]|nr:hypothetical protein FRC12_003932 [Ceratobasidium sp. 428]
MRAVLTPPTLPTFLADMFDLKPIEGIPSDEEVKMVHAAMRALSDVVNMPKLYDADLAMQLAQYLFSVQMTRYRGIYPCVIFPSDQNTVYTPPPLPAHVPVTLGPVSGSPTDEQIKSVQAAIRHSESLANVPSMFDANLSMKLSQHLFDIQFERYLRQIVCCSSGPETPSQPGYTSAHDSETDDTGEVQGAGDDASIPERNEHDIMHTESATSRELDEPGKEPPRSQTMLSRTSSALPDQFHPISVDNVPGSNAETLITGLGDTNKLLVEINDGIQDLKRVFIVAQQSMARGLSCTKLNTSGRQSHHTVLNDKGEDPHTSGLPSLSNFYYGWRNCSGPFNIVDAARYLQFYGIGRDLIEEGIEPKLKDGKDEAAQAELRKYLCV